MILFDLSEDPSEQNDISENHPDIVAKMEQIMEEARVPSPIFPFGADK